MRVYFFSYFFNYLKTDKMTCQALNQIFEDRFVFEEGAYRAYATDEKTNLFDK